MTGPRRGRPADAWLTLALLCFAAGAVVLAVTWYEVSGLALTAEQLPYLASGGFGGLALVVAGAGCLTAGRAARVEARLAELIRVATEPATEPAAGAVAEPVAGPATDDPAADATVLTVEHGTTYHQPGCRLLGGKATTGTTAGQAREQGLRPCPVCH